MSRQDKLAAAFEALMVICAGHPASKVPGMLRDLVAEGMAQLEAVVEEASRVDEDAVAARPLGTPALPAAPPLISGIQALGLSSLQ